MEPFYDRLLSSVFPTAKAATENCRNLAREFGFTIKQETSSNKVCPIEGVHWKSKNSCGMIADVQSYVANWHSTAAPINVIG